MRHIQPVIPSGDVGKLLEGMKETGFQGRKLGESVDIWAEMILDPECTVFLGLSGAMMPAGMQECLISLAENHFFDVLVSTGANIFHDVCEHIGVHHYRGHHHADDQHLYNKGIDRIYDVFAYEEQFRSVDRKISEFTRGISPFKGSSQEYLKMMAGWLSEMYPEGRSLLATCVQRDIPVFVPAICDSSIGIGALIARRGGTEIDIDQIADTDEITCIVEGASKTGVIYIGGGVPKNFIQQTQVIASIHGNDCGGHAYAIQYTTDAPHWGGLSGCTFEEAISWGKESVDTRHVQCFCDATISLPIVVSALLSREIRRKA